MLTTHIPGNKTTISFICPLPRESSDQNDPLMLVACTVIVRISSIYADEKDTDFGGDHFGHHQTLPM